MYNVFHLIAIILVHPSLGSHSSRSMLFIHLNLPGVNARYQSPCSKLPMAELIVCRAYVCGQLVHCLVLSQEKSLAPTLFEPHV